MSCVPVDQNETRTLLQAAVKSNKQHQHGLAVYTQRLEDELAKVELLLEAAEQDDEGDAETAIVEIPGAKKATSLIPPSYFLKPESPFYEEASRRTRYLSATVIHPMSKKELDALAEGVKESNHRRLAFEAKRNGKLLWDIDTRDLLTNTEGLDWSRIAEKVSDVSGHTRTAKECETRWIGDRHPSINHEAWDTWESIKLAELLDRYEAGKINWKEVALKLGTNRTPLECMRHGTSKPHHYWDTRSDAALRKAVDTYGLDNWNLVARHVSPQATASQCQTRFMKTLDPRVKKGAWTDDEDERLRAAVETYGNSWLDVASVVHGRINEQCRERWVSRLDPALKRAPWTEEEDASLMTAYNEVGKKWTDLSKRLNNGRTDTQCRRRVEQLIKQKVTKEKAAEKAAVAEEKARAAEEKMKATEERRQEAQRRKQEAKQQCNIRFMQPRTADLGQPVHEVGHLATTWGTSGPQAQVRAYGTPAPSEITVIMFNPESQPSMTARPRPTPRRIQRETQEPAISAPTTDRQDDTNR